MEQKKHAFEIQINAISDADNPTKKDVEFIIHDFGQSHNYAFINKTTAQKTLHTLKGMPIVCQYFPSSERGAKDDGLGSHGMYLDVARNGEDEFVAMDSLAIGVFTEDAYITTIVENGEEKEVVAGKGILWASRYPNIIGLLKEWVDEGIPVTSSMEILYDSYKVEDGITEILSYCYEGHCVLQSKDTEEHSKIYPAYDVSRLTKMVAQALNQDSKKEGENMEKFKKVFELSHDDIRSLIYRQFDPQLGESQDSYVSDVFESYFVVNVYSWDENESFDKYFKYNYTKNEQGVEIDFESKVEVFSKRNWEEVIPEEVQVQLNEKTESIKNLESQVNSITNAKTELEQKFNETSETLIQLNSKVDELTPFKEQVEQEKFESMLSEKTEFYSSKFKALNASEKFESEDVQELIKKSISETDGKDAILQINSMLVDLVVSQKEENPAKNAIKEMASKRENLIPDSNDFDSRYSQ